MPIGVGKGVLIAVNLSGTAWAKEALHAIRTPTMEQNSGRNFLSITLTCDFD